MSGENRMERPKAEKKIACDGPIGMRAARAGGLSRFRHKLPNDTSRLSKTLHKRMSSDD